MNAGTLYVVGLGPGGAEYLTGEARDAIAGSTAFFGYGPYLDRLDLAPHQRRIASDNREELLRARAALDCAVAGETACIVSGGDPGVFAMAAAVCEAIEAGPEAYRAVDLRVVPGITAMLAAAARVGAPLGHDFAAISLSDNLKPWALIEKRLRLVAQAGMAMALYNPVSKARPHQLGTALDVLRDVLPGSAPVIFARAVGRPDERIALTTLAEADPAQADMATCILIGSPETRVVARPGMSPLVYTPRAAGERP